MLDETGDFIRECLIHAADYRYKPQLLDDPDVEQHLHQMELRWLELAISYEFASRFPRCDGAVETATSAGPECDAPALLRDFRDAMARPAGVALLAA